ncbi:MAG: hypothetical protein R2815_10540 [Flavobacteriales bacterium]
MTSNSLFIALIMGLSGTCMGQAVDQEKDLQRAPAVADPYQGGWQSAVQKENADLWRSVADDAGRNSEALLNQYRSERNASLARNNGAIPEAEQQSLDALARRLEVTAPGTFEAYLARFYADLPKESAFAAVEQATLTGKDRVEVIGPALLNAARTGDQVAMATWGKALKERGDVAPGLWALTDDVLLSTEQHAVLFVAGEMDAYPLWSKQMGYGARKDLLIVDVRLLENDGYRKRIWTEAGAKGKVPDGPAAFIERMANSTERPVYLSLSLGPRTAGPMRDKLYITGLVARYSATPWDNLPALAFNWRTMSKRLDAGPLSRNYLLPGAVLLEHYRAVGDEANASRAEHELRGLAERLGATGALIRAGVLQH